MENSTLRLKMNSKSTQNPSRSPSCRATEGVGLLMMGAPRAALMGIDFMGVYCVCPHGNRVPGGLAATSNPPRPFTCTYSYSVDAFFPKVGVRAGNPPRE